MLWIPHKPIFRTKNIPQKWAHGNSRIGAKEPFLGHIDGHKGKWVRFRLQSSEWGLLGLLGPHWDCLGPLRNQKGTFWAKTGPFGTQLFSFFFKCLNPSVGPSLISSAVLYQHLKIWKIHFSQFEGFCPRAQLSGA